jgi:hypothetical protein
MVLIDEWHVSWRIVVGDTVYGFWYWRFGHDCCCCLLGIYFYTVYSLSIVGAVAVAEP